MKEKMVVVIFYSLYDTLYFMIVMLIFEKCFYFIDMPNNQDKNY